MAVVRWECNLPLREQEGALILLLWWLMRYPSLLHYHYSFEERVFQCDSERDQCVWLILRTLFDRARWVGPVKKTLSIFILGQKVHGKSAFRSVRSMFLLKYVSFKDFKGLGSESVAWEQSRGRGKVSWGVCNLKNGCKSPYKSKRCFEASLFYVKSY